METAKGVELLQQQGRITEIPDRDRRIEAIAKDYAAKPANTLVVSPDNASRRDINEAIRKELRSTGALSNEDRTFSVLTQRSELTSADRSWAAKYQPGDLLYYTRGSKQLGIERGSYATVVSVDAGQNRLAVKRPDGEHVTRVAGMYAWNQLNRRVKKGSKGSLLLARSHSGATCVEAKDMARRLAPLPISLLPCQDETLTVFTRWGVRTLGVLAALPETSLISRIGQQARRLQRLARGTEEHLLVPEEPEFTLSECVTLDTPSSPIRSMLSAFATNMARRPGPWPVSMTEEYVELHARSAFSFLEGASMPEALVQQAANLGMSALGILDRDGLYGAPRLYTSAKKLGLRSHVGAEVSVGDLGFQIQPPEWQPHSIPQRPVRLSLLCES